MTKTKHKLMLNVPIGPSGTGQGHNVNRKTFLKFHKFHRDGMSHLFYIDQFSCQNLTVSGLQSAKIYAAPKNRDGLVILIISFSLFV